MAKAKATNLPKLTGDEVREFRRKHGMSQTEFGKLLDLSLPTIWRVESQNIITDIIYTLAFYWLIGRVLEGDFDLLENPEAIEATRLTPETLKAKREELGVSQHELARMLGVSFATVNRWENRRVDVSALLVVGMALESLKMKAEGEKYEAEMEAEIKKRFPRMKTKLKKKKES